MESAAAIILLVCELVSMYVLFGHPVVFYRLKENPHTYRHLLPITGIKLFPQSTEGFISVKKFCGFMTVLPLTDLGEASVGGLSMRTQCALSAWSLIEGGSFNCFFNSCSAKPQKVSTLQLL